MRANILPKSQLGVLFLLCAVSVAPAGLIATGDVSPADPATWTDSTEGAIGDTTVGNLLVDDDSDLLSYRGYIGNGSGAQGHVTVTGACSTWTNASHLYVGNYGDGTLSIAAGGSVSNGGYSYIGHFDGSTGRVTVNGPGSTLTNGNKMYVGEGGGGELDISAGGTVTTLYAQVARVSSASCAVTVDGPGSIWTITNSLDVGGKGDGTVTITNGGHVVDTDGSIGGNSTAGTVVTVDGPASTWTNSYRVYVGYLGDGALTITNGGAVSGFACIIGGGVGDAGEVTVDGAGSALDCSDCVYVGGGGNGTLNILNGATVTSVRGQIVPGSWPWFSSTGAVTVDGPGSTWALSGDLCVGGYGPSGTMTITNGSLVTIGGGLWIYDGFGQGEGYINMTQMGMLALWGQADNSIIDFLDLIEGTDDLRYWNGQTWIHITNATEGVDYTLTYFDAGALAGYTVLTVPEPATLGLLSLAAMALLRRQRT